MDVELRHIFTGKRPRPLEKKQDSVVYSLSISPCKLSVMGLSRGRQHAGYGYNYFPYAGT